MKIVYLLPGLLCDETVWRHQAEHLADIADVRIPNFKGFDSLTAMGQAVLDDAAGGHFYLVGHSMGGRVALEVMNLAPQQVIKLALLDTGVHPRREGEAEGRQRLVDLAEQQGMHALAREWATPMVHPDNQQGTLMEEIYAMVERYSFEEYRGQIKALLERPDASPYLANIHCPTLVMCGREDIWSTVQQHEDFITQISDARLQVIEHSGHMSTMEQPQVVTDALRDWLQG